MTTKKIYSPWIKWHGDERPWARPVSPDTLVQVRFRDGTIEPVLAASEYCWYHDDGDDDIVEYCIVTEQANLDTTEQLLCANGCIVTEQADLGAAEQLLRANGYTVTKPLTFEDVVPMTEAPPEGTEYWFVDPTANNGVHLTQFDNYKFEHKRIKRRMAYLDHEHALIAARHIFGLKGGEL